MANHEDKPEDVPTRTQVRDAVQCGDGMICGDGVECGDDASALPMLRGNADAKKEER